MASYIAIKRKDILSMKTLRENRKKIMRAWIYIILGSAITLGGIAFIIFMYFSGTFLPGNHLLRYPLYGLMFILAFAGSWIAQEGITYLSRCLHERRRRS